MKAPDLRIDPRTVPRSRMLERLGSRRPELSIVTLVGPGLVRAGDVEKAIGGKNTAAWQIILACSGDIEVPPGMSSVRQHAGESTIELVNRASALAVGKLLCISVLGRANSADWPQAAAAFAHDARLGAIALGTEAADALMARESLWTALGGLEAAFSGFDMAIDDFCRRARAIGFLAPRAPSPPGCDANAALLRQRMSLASDLSIGLSQDSGPAPRFTLYTAITDRYDTLKPQPAEAVDGIEQVAFLDDGTAAEHQGRSRGWRVTAMTPAHGDPHRAARFPKINAHLVLPGSDYSLWVDASIGIVSPFPLRRLVELFLHDHDICLFRHYARRSVYEEAEVCKAYGLDRAEVIDAQMARYRAEGLPDESGLIEAPVILRRHTDAIRRLNETWWNEVIRGSRRDQLSFNYAAWKLGLRCATFPLSLAAGNGLFVKFMRQKAAAIDQPAG